MRRRPSVILIREAEEQLTGSGCCGRLEGDFLWCDDGKPVFPGRRAAKEAMGRLYRELRDRYGDAVEIQVVDPRNVSLLLMLIRDFWAYGAGLAEAFRTLTRLPVQAVVVNGRLLTRGDPPEAAEVAAVLDGELSLRGAAHSGAL